MNSYTSDDFKRLKNPIETAKCESSEVLYSTKSDVHLSYKEVVAISKKAQETSRGRLRFCLHTEIDNPLHEMLIVHPYKAYVPPHKHHDQSESIFILEGTMDLIIFDDLGVVVNVVPMGPVNSGRVFHHRLGKPQFHTMLIHSKQVVFTEVKTGPYYPEKTELAEWAPDSSDLNGVDLFLKKLFRDYQTIG